MMEFRSLLLLGVATLALLTGPNATAQSSFPQKPITFVVPYPPGGVTDVSARVIAKALPDKLGQPVVVENVGGAGGMIGMNKARRAPADGYTIVLVNRPIITFRPTMDASFPIAPGRDYSPLAMVAENQSVIAINPSSKFKTFAEMMAFAKANPGAVSYGSPGIGTASHLAVEYLAQMAGVKFMHIPYQGEGAAQVDLIGGRVDFAILGSIVKEQVAAGKLVAAAVTGKERWKLFPDVPTIEASGFPNYSFTSFVGVAAPPGLPPDAYSKLATALGQVMAVPEVRTAFEGMGLDVNPKVGQAFAAYVEEDLALWKKFIASTGLTLN